MPPRADLFRWIKVSLPFLLALALGLYPRSFAVESALSGVRLDAAASHAPSAAKLSAAADQLPWRGDLLEAAGVAAAREGNSRLAVEELLRARSLGVISANGMVVLGDAALQIGNSSLAVAAWNEALQKAGSDHAGIYQRIEAFDRSKHDYASLREVLAAHVGEYPKDAGALYQLGVIDALDRRDAAGSELSQASALDSTLTSQAHAVQAGLDLAARQSDPGMQDLLIGRALGAAGEWWAAREAFEQAVAQDPANGEAWAFLGEAEQQNGADGAEALTKAVNLAGSSVLVQALQGVYWIRQGKPDRALIFLHAAASLEPDNPVWQAQLGEASAMLGSLTDAAGYFQQAVQLAPRNPVYWRMLASFCLDHHYMIGEVGLPAARQGVLLDPAGAESLDLMGQVFTALEDTINAERYFARAISAAPNAAGPHLHLGFLLLQEGDTVTARQQLQLASNLQPGSSIGQQADRLIQQYFPAN